MSPIGVVNASVAANATSMVPFSTSAAMSSSPIVAAAGGSGARPSTASQNSPDRSLVTTGERPLAFDCAGGVTSSSVAVAQLYDARTSRQTTSSSTSSRGPKTSMVPLIGCGSPQPACSTSL